MLHFLMAKKTWCNRPLLVVIFVPEEKIDKFVASSARWGIERGSGGGLWWGGEVGRSGVWSVVLVSGGEVGGVMGRSGVGR